MNIPKLTLPRWPKGERVQKPSVEGAPLAWCYLLTAVGCAALVGSTWMLLVFVAGSVGHVDWAFSYRADESGVQEDRWHYEASIHLLVGIGLFLFCLSIAMFNATWLETRRHLTGLIRNVVTGIGIAVALFMISGAIVVQQRGTDARARDEIVATNTARAAAGSIEAQVAAIDARLAQMRDKRLNNEYAAAAANVGVAAYDAGYLSAEAMAKTPAERRDIVRRARGAAIAADALEEKKAALVSQLGAAKVETVQAEAVSVRAEGFMAPAVAFLEDARKPITAVLGELLALTAFSFALAAWQSRRLAETAEDAMPIMIEDHSAETEVLHPRTGERVNVEPMKPAEKREQYFDEDGNKIVRRKATWAKVPTKKSGRKIVDPKTGKKVDDTTEYELAPSPDKVHLNEGYEDAGADSWGAAVGAAVANSDGANSQAETLTPEPEEKADAEGLEALGGGVGADLDGAVGATSIVDQSAHLDSRSDSVDDGSADPSVASNRPEEPAPLILADEEVDRLIDKGVLVEDEDGIRAVSQEDQPVIEQEADVVNLPQLPAPKRETEEAA